MGYECHNGDCTELMRLILTESVDLICTDVPYGVGFTSDNTTYDDSRDYVLETMPMWYKEWIRVLKEKSWMFLFTGIKNINKWIDEGERAGFTFKNILSTRSFNRGGCSSKSNFVFEMQPVLCFTKGKVGRQFNEVDFFPASSEWLRDKRNTKKTLFTYAYSNLIPSEVSYGTATFGSVGKEQNYHPNEKSEKLTRFLIEIATDDGGKVLDPFMGSGTTGAAAVSVGREFIGYEIDKRWCEIAEARIEGVKDWKRMGVKGEEENEDGKKEVRQEELF